MVGVFNFINVIFKEPKKLKNVLKLQKERIPSAHQNPRRHFCSKNFQCLSITQNFVFSVMWDEIEIWNLCALFHYIQTILMFTLLIFLLIWEMKTILWIIFNCAYIYSLVFIFFYVKISLSLFIFYFIYFVETKNIWKRKKKFFFLQTDIY